jgi:hypothetical protein
MFRHQLFFLIFLFFSINLSAQGIQLENRWKRDWKHIYVGIENPLYVQGANKSINSIRCENAACSIVADTVFVHPRGEGPVDIELYTNQGTYIFKYNAKMLPLPIVDINGPNGKGTVVAKNKIDKSYLEVSSGELPSEDLYKNYIIDGFDVIVAGTRYYVKGKEFSPQVKTAMNKLNSGDVFSVEQVHLRNRENGLPFDFAMSSRFKIL